MKYLDFHLDKIETFPTISTILTSIYGINYDNFAMVMRIGKKGFQLLKS